MEKLCIVCGKGTTNSQNGICVICTLFDRERVAEFLKNNQVEKGDMPTNTGNSIKIRGRQSTIAHHNNKENRSYELSKVEAKIADRLDASGESAIILKKLA